ncbi:acetyl/propionyl/methylcrotonyl-CoA carboxylase subunit alpha [Actinomadura sp. NTSP31]|uniref:acetyl-CoA carboxylase biotin carboxylase subunit n=1 Tax=Actinomadura sp. NTSP31 TaxID=1735447 RepID=UPI0035C1AF32
MFKRLLIANRGEIALRVARTCRELGIEVVAVHSSADADSPVVRLADDAVRIGPPAAADSYLNIPAVIEAARITGADAVHPGYGFLSEDADFAEICALEGLAFVGPRPPVMKRLGNKAVARALMTEAGLPLLPGTLEPVSDVPAAARAAERIGYPVIIKAAAGGGGRGMTVVHDPADLPEAFRSTVAVAHAVFRDPAVYVERYLSGARHIEVQVLCGGEGTGVHLGERDCSVQRRHQKLVEEAPSTRLDRDLREEIGAAALRGALSVGYTGAGTVEFLLDDAGNFYFMEVNARIQVEHPVTEMVTGIDLVREQILIAAGVPFGLDQGDVSIGGAAVECRINAEDPARDFAPSPGTLEVFDPPSGPGVRVDSGYRAGMRVSPYYDSLVAKLIAWAPDRDTALARMDRALEEFRIEGVATTVGLHRAIVNDPVFRAGDHDLDFIRRFTSPHDGALVS